MRVLSLRNSAKFGCFSSINDKITNNLPRWGCFQPNFQWSVAAKLLMVPKKVWGEMMARTTSIIMQNLVEIERRASVWEDEVWYFSLFLFVYNARTHNGCKWRSCVIQEEIASVFVDWFRCGLQRFLGKKSPFKWIERIWKLSIGGATIDAPMHGKIFKIWENGCKVCTHHFGHKRGERKVLPQPSTPCIVDVHPHKNILLQGVTSDYQVHRGSAKNGRQNHSFCSPKCY